MTHRKLMSFMAIALAASACRAESFYLKADKTNVVFGPFEYKDGAKVPLGENVFTVVRKVTVKMTVPQKLKKTIIPKVEFRDVGIRDVVEFLRQASIDYSPPADDHHKGVNFILLLKGRPEPKVTFQARELSLGDVLEAVVSVTELKLRIEGNVVYVEPGK